MFRRRVQSLAALVATFWPALVFAQAPQPSGMAMDMSMDAAGWQFMQDAVVFGMFNHQGGPRGGNEIRVPNWWMGMFSRKFHTSDFTFNTMLSLDPATVGERG